MVSICLSDLFFFLGFFFCIVSLRIKLLSEMEKKNTTKKNNLTDSKVLPHFSVHTRHWPPEDISCLTLYDVHALMYSIFKDIALYPSALPTGQPEDEGGKKGSVVSCTAFASAKKKQQKNEKKRKKKVMRCFMIICIKAAVGCLGLLCTTCVYMYAVPLVCCEICWLLSLYKGFLYKSRLGNLMSLL